jgi:hypothetical protein
MTKFKVKQVYNDRQIIRFLEDETTSWLDLETQINALIKQCRNLNLSSNSTYLHFNKHERSVGRSVQGFETLPSGFKLVDFDKGFSIEEEITEAEVVSIEMMRGALLQQAISLGHQLQDRWSLQLQYHIDKDNVLSIRYYLNLYLK